MMGISFNLIIYSIFLKLNLLFMKSACLKVGLMLSFFLIGLFAWSQNKRITGRVLSQEDSKPLAGVTVSVKGKNAATQTNAEGVFTLDAADSDVLVFSYSG